jgi:long-chain acyl-CoA synthetase
LWDKLIFNKTKAALGGRVEMMVTGGAPMHTDALNFLKIVMCCPMLEGYGLSESTAGGFITNLNDATDGHNGGPGINVEFKLVSVRELDYRSIDKDVKGVLTTRGEICLRGPSIFLDYFKD